MPVPNTIHRGLHKLIPAIFVLLSGCASVPREVVELSHTVGEDVRAIQHSYDALITARFDALRQERLDYLNHEWKPMFLEDWVASGRLIDTAQGEVVYSDAEDAFVPPDAGRAEQQRLATILQWSEAAMVQIDAKRGELLDPLYQREVSIRADMNAAFNQIISANAQVTAHLSSIRRVKAVQGEALSRIDARDEVRQLNQTIMDVSEWAREGLEEIREANQRLD